jgi:hypothetical protein
VTCGQCNKPRHSKEHCHWNPNNPNNKLKDKKEVVINEDSAQLGGIGNKSGDKGVHGKVNKSSSIIYHRSSSTFPLNIKFMIIIIKTQLRPCSRKR